MFNQTIERAADLRNALGSWPAETAAATATDLTFVFDRRPGNLRETRVVPVISAYTQTGDNALSNAEVVEKLQKCTCEIWLDRE